MAVLSKAEISALSSEERLELINNLWESLEAPPEGIAAAAPGWQRQILDDRLLDLEMFPGDDISLVEARDQSLI
jgi:putative addiction module component (TIGR02574 family)